MRGLLSQMRGPQPSGDPMKDLSHMRRFYERLAQTKGDTDAYWATGFHQSLLIEKINKILSGIHGSRIIDVGCGDGRTVLFLAERHNVVVGIDISYTRLSRAKQKARRYPHHTLFAQSYAETLPVKGEGFDGAICTEVLEHVIDDEALLTGLFNILKPNGWAVMSIPTVSLSRYFDMYYLKKPIYFDPNAHVREFTHYKIPWFENNFILVKELEKRLKGFGLTVMKRYGIGFELPLWIRRFKIGQLLEKLCKIRKINTFISTLPILKNFPVYTIFTLRKSV